MRGAAEMANEENLSSAVTNYFYTESMNYVKEIKKITKRHARKLRETIREQSPFDKTLMDHKEHGVYKNGWRVSTEEGPTYIVCTVRQYRRPSLTWLLEDGHELVQGGRTKPQPHIKDNGDAEGALWIEELMNL